MHTKLARQTTSQQNQERHKETQKKLARLLVYICVAAQTQRSTLFGPLETELVGQLFVAREGFHSAMSTSSPNATTVLAEGTQH